MSIMALMENVSIEGWVEGHADGSRSLRLEYPFEIKVNGDPEMVEALRFRRPRFGELDVLEKAAKSQTLLKSIREFARLLVVEPKGLSPKHIENLDTEDGFRLVALMTDFLQKP